jgi:hypothetical protein
MGTSNQEASVSNTERRKRRSDVPAEALELYLRATAERRNARMLALADADGLLVSGFGGSREALSSLAAVSPLGPVPEAVFFDDLGSCDEMRAEPFQLYGTTFYLASMGGVCEPFTDAPAAITRILT